MSFLSAGNGLYLDLDGGYMSIKVCKYSLSHTFLCTFYSCKKIVI